MAMKKGKKEMHNKGMIQGSAGMGMGDDMPSPGSRPKKVKTIKPVKKAAKKRNSNY